jgi:hypothetical protein
MIDLFVQTPWIPLIYLFLGIFLIGGPFFPIWNRYMDKADAIKLSDSSYIRLNKICRVSGLVLLGVSWYVIVTRKFYGMHIFIAATFMIQPAGLGLLVFGVFTTHRRLRIGTMIAYLLVALYSCWGMIVIHDIFWCARRTDWYTHSWSAGEDLLAFCTFFFAPYDYLIFGEAMMLQLILLVGAAISLLYALRKRLKKIPENFDVQEVLSEELPQYSSKSNSYLKKTIIPLLLFYATLFFFAVSVDIIDEIRTFGEIQYTLALHLYLPTCGAFCSLGFLLLKREKYNNPPWFTTLHTFIGLMFVNSIGSLIGCAQLIPIFENPNMHDLYLTITSLFNLPWNYASMTFLFVISVFLFGSIFVILFWLNLRKKH